MPQTRNWTRCIALVPHGHVVGAQVKRLAAARDWVPVEQHDSHLAMAEICIRLRAQRARRSWGLPSGEKLALVVVDPDGWDSLDALITAIQRFAPEVAIWSFAYDELLPLAKALQAEHATQDSESSIEPTLAPTRGHPLRITESAPEGDADFDAGDTTPDAEASFDDNHDDFTPGISPEEIEMLLAGPGSEEPDR